MSAFKQLSPGWDLPSPKILTLNQYSNLLAIVDLENTLHLIDLFTKGIFKKISFDFQIDHICFSKNTNYLTLKS
jgi:hypothetical protein